MVSGLFQPNQKNFMKHVLVLFAIILALIPVVKAEDKSCDHLGNNDQRFYLEIL
jgi:hypothetical protein